MDSDFEELKPVLAVLLRGNEGSLSFRNIGLSFIGKGDNRELIIENARAFFGCVPAHTREAWRGKLNKSKAGNYL
jgi:hypothetical protein